MKTIKFWFWNARKAKQDGKPLTLTDRLIMMRSALTHVEQQFVDRGGVSFSATLADDANGCRFKYIGYSNPQRWECLTFIVPDEVEAIMWRTACLYADMPENWQEQAERIYLNGKRPQIYQGANHVIYDTSGLLSFALRKSGKWWLDAVRGTVWCWTKLPPFKPDKVKGWCSEMCCNVWNDGWMGFYGYPEKVFTPLEISPQELYDKLLAIKGR